MQNHNYIYIQINCTILLVNALVDIPEESHEFHVSIVLARKSWFFAAM